MSRWSIRCRASCWRRSSRCGSASASGRRSRSASHWCSSSCSSTSIRASRKSARPCSPMRRMLGMSERQLMRHVYWPSALSWMFSSLHTSVGFAVVGAVVGEYLGSAAGLGYLIQQAEGVFDVAGVFAGMFVLAAFVIVIDASSRWWSGACWSGGRWRPRRGPRQRLFHGAYRAARTAPESEPAVIQRRISMATSSAGWRLRWFALALSRACIGAERSRSRSAARMPLLSADHAGQATRRIREGRRECRRGRVQGRLARRSRR